MALESYRYPVPGGSRGSDEKPAGSPAGRTICPSMRMHCIEGAAADDRALSTRCGRAR